MFKGFEQLNCSITRVSNDKEIQPKSDPCIRELDGLKMGSGHHYCHVTEKRVEKLETGKGKIKKTRVALPFPGYIERLHEESAE